METIESGSLVVGNNFYAWALGNWHREIVCLILFCA